MRKCPVLFVSFAAVLAVCFNGCVTVPLRTVTIDGQTCAANSGPATATRQLQKNFTVAAQARISVKNLIGPVIMTSWDVNTVDVAVETVAHGKDAAEAKALLEKTDVEFDAKERELTVRVVQKGKPVRRGGVRLLPEVRLTVRAPRGILPQVETALGDIRISGELGAATASALAGDITIADVRGSISATAQAGKITLHRVEAANIVATANRGDIEFDDVSARIMSRIGAGNLSATGVAGKLRAEVRMGDIRVKDPRGPVEAATTTGTVHIWLEREDLPGDLVATVKTGNIELSGPEGLRADLRAAVTQGAVKNEFHVEARGSLSASRVWGDVNLGGKVLKLEVESGTIELKARKTEKKKEEPAEQTFSQQLFP
ncbi:MAG: DUF4097 family beta strand repeat protein [Kiritimatiellae bacterium]|nr:DUF4097 family beta strand repeat protein [Kiritimatiellia bacterium]